MKSMLLTDAQRARREALGAEALRVGVRHASYVPPGARTVADYERLARACA